MFKRKVYNEMLRWKSESTGESALLIEGARRVGKSTIAEEFGRSEYRSYALFDFSKVTDAFRETFLDLRSDIDALAMYLQTYANVRLYERESLVIFDEVQLFPQAREFLKHLVADGRFDYLETGSLVSIKENVKDIVIPSEEDALSLDPLDFEEFLLAMGEELLADAIRDSFACVRPLPEDLHRKAERLFREYMLVGGMPQAVAEYVSSRDMEAVDRRKRRILRLYRDDIVKYAGNDKARVQSVFAGIPGQLSKHEKRFTLASIDKDARSREYDGAFFWLDDARIANVCYNSTDPTVGLALNEDNATLKCYMADTGLLISHAFASNRATPNSVYRDILFGKIDLNEGMLVENAVAQQLHASGHRLFFYSQYSAVAADRMEIDFLIEREYENAAMRMRVSPVEVKSAKRYGTSSLSKYKAKFAKRVGTQYVLHPRPMRHDVDAERVCLPLYMAHLL
ncbi:MAG: ATP-binding protein [Atopobiaceae bacterium]|nr:ATP-binding protein [Atopobiaceae bacterium]